MPPESKLAEKVKDVAAAQSAGTSVERANKSIYAVVRDHEQQFAKALPAHVDPARFTRLAVTALRDNPRLATCEAQTILAGLMRAAQYGLEPNDQRGQCWLIPRRIKGQWKAQFQFGYVGLIDLAARAGIVVNAFDIHEHDSFVFDQGSGAAPSHTYSLIEERGDVIAYWAKGTLPDGRVEFRILRKKDVEAIRDRYAATKDREGKISGPWADPDQFHAMARKSTIIRLLKYMPLPVEVADAVLTAERIDAGVEISAPAEPVIDVEGYEGDEQADDANAAAEPGPASNEDAAAGFDCDVCQGSGRDPEHDDTLCVACNGSGSAS